MRLWIKDHEFLLWLMVAILMTAMLPYADLHSDIAKQGTFFLFFYSIIMMTIGILSSREATREAKNHLFSLQGQDPYADKCILYCRKRGVHPQGLVMYALSKSMGGK